MRKDNDWKHCKKSPVGENMELMKLSQQLGSPKGNRQQKGEIF